MNIQIHSCKNNATAIRHLQQLGKRQKDNFVDVYPWEEGCKTNYIYYSIVSQNEKGEELLLGIMVIMKNENHYYVNAISTVSKRLSQYQGLGTAIMKRLIEDTLKDPKIDYIMLTPLNDKVRSFYTKLGFIEYTTDWIHMYYPIRRHLTNEEICNNMPLKYRFTDQQLEEQFQIMKRRLNKLYREKLQFLIDINSSDKDDITDMYLSYGIDSVKEYLDEQIEDLD